MKTVRILLFFFISIVFLSSCHKEDSVTNPANQDAYLSIIVGGDFQSDLVKVALNNDVLVDDTMLTNYSIAAAWTSGLKKMKAGQKTILAEMGNFNILASQEFTLKDTLTVIVNYDRASKQLKFNFYKGFLLLY